MEWKDIAGAVGKAAPILGTLLGGPAGPAIGSIVASVLGTGGTPEDVQAALSSDPQALVKLREIEATKAVRFEELAREQAKLEISTAAADRANSRDMNARIQESAQASWLAKNAGYMLDFLIVAATLLLVALLAFRAVPPENKEIAFALLGSLMTLCGTVVQWHRGSSAGSEKKTELMARRA